MSTTLILLLLLGSTYAATHVNITIAQHPADVSYVDGPAPAELRAGPADFSYRDEQHSARLIQPEAQAQQQQESTQAQTARVQVQSSGSSSSSSSGGGSSTSSGTNAAQQVSTQSQSGLAPPLPPRNVAPQMRRRGHFRRVSMQQRTPHSSQFRATNQQAHQNQEFERYVQTYGGPTVETVFESSSPAPQRQEQSRASTSSSTSASSASSAAPQRQVIIGSRPKQLHTFERQVALPVAAQQSANVEQQQQQQQQDTKPIYEVQQSAPVAKAAVASNSVNSAGSKAVAPNDGKPLFESNQAGVGAGYDLAGFDAATSYNRPSYDQSSYNYDDSQDLQDQYPPAIDAGDSQGYSDYDDQTQYINQQAPAKGYLPQRPVVMKTIQIVQPALKAKKYEVRHPAIQKEFYDIEERVIIKPAGTLVVELDHPVAKIPRGETVLALGHPHPAVAGAYNTNAGVTQTQTSSGVYNNQHQQQYSPSNLYAPTKQAVEQPVLGSTTVGSSVTTLPAYDQAPKDGFVEAKLRQPYNSGGNDAQFVSTTERSEQQSAGKDILLAADRNGFQLQLNSKKVSPKQVVREEDELRYEPSVDVRSNGAPLTSNFERSQEASYNYNPNNQYQSNFNGNHQFNDAYYNGEYIDDNANNANNQDSKPARLQQAESPATTTASHAHVIRHEHNINLPPSQHNIYLSRSVQVPKEQRFTDDTELPAQVTEIRPYLQRQPGSRVVYAKAQVRPAVNKVRSGAYNNQRAEPSYFRQHESARYREPEPDSIEYSAPYSRMRYNPEQSARLEQATRPEKPLVVDEPAQATPGHTHIQIQVPQHRVGDKPITVSSTIGPPVSAARTANYRQPAYAYATNPNREVETFNEQRGDQPFGQLQSKPDCEQVEAAPYRSQIRPFQRLVEAPAATQATSSSSSSSTGGGGGSSNSNSKANANLPNVQAEKVDVLLKSTAGHLATGQRVIAATAAPTDAASSRETFHKRRIVVNHPFQTVREVVEHEPITNYHQIQVSEPASPALYHQAAYYQPPEGTHGNLVYQQSSATHGNLFEPAALQYG